MTDKNLKVIKQISIIFGWLHIIGGALDMVVSLYLGRGNWERSLWTIAFGIVFIGYVNQKYINVLRDRELKQNNNEK